MPSRNSCHTASRSWRSCAARSRQSANPTDGRSTLARAHPACARRPGTAGYLCSAATAAETRTMTKSAKTSYAIGIDLGATKTEAALVDAEGDIADRQRTPTEAAKGPDHVVEIVVSLVKTHYL